LHVIK
jgi:hypothetical protein